VAVEEDAATAWAALDRARVAPYVLVGLLAVLFVALGLVLRVVLRLRRDVQAARELGQYTLVELLGEGGTGQVWRARHALLARPAAVKLLRPDALGADALLRFEREMQVTARLTHPNTVEIYDCGRTEDGRFFYAMECLEGISLQRLSAAHGAQDGRRVVHLLRQACASLAEAHAAGLVHRDVKPGNLMLCRRAGELDVVKVLDFGLVKDLSAPAADATAVMGLAGTPAYMSPERLRHGTSVDARCDVWAVGAVGFRLLTGRDLWRGSLAEILAQIISHEPPRTAALAPGPLPAGLDELLSDCLQREPDRRPADAGALLTRLEALGVPPWTQQDARAWWAEHEAAPSPEVITRGAEAARAPRA
jgi:eukaryotic-like serine/threonine-protein kinase